MPRNQPAKTIGKNNKNSSKSVLNGYVQKKVNTKKKSSADEKLLKRVENLERNISSIKHDVNSNIALIWNLKVENENESVFDSEDTRFKAVCDFLNEVIRQDNYSEHVIDKCEWISTRKNILQVTMYSKIIDKVLMNQWKYKDMVGKNGKKIRFERKKTIGQVENFNAAKELRDRILDYLYLKNDSDVSKTPFVYANNGKIQIGKKEDKKILTMSQALDEFVDIDFEKPLNLCVNPFDKKKKNTVSNVAEDVKNESFNEIKSESQL